MNSSPFDTKTIWSGRDRRHRPCLSPKIVILTSYTCIKLDWQCQEIQVQGIVCCVQLYIHWSNWVMWRVKEETPNIPHCSVLTWCQSKESFRHHYFRSNMELPLRLEGKKTRKQLLNPDFASCCFISILTMRCCIYIYVHYSIAITWYLV